MFNSGRSLTNSFPLWVSLGNSCFMFCLHLPDLLLYQYLVYSFRSSVRVRAHPCTAPGSGLDLYCTHYSTLFWRLKQHLFFFSWLNATFPGTRVKQRVFFLGGGNEMALLGLLIVCFILGFAVALLIFQHPNASKILFSIWCNLTMLKQA